MITHGLSMRVKKLPVRRTLSTCCDVLGLVRKSMVHSAGPVILRVPGKSSLPSVCSNI